MNNRTWYILGGVVLIIALWMLLGGDDDDSRHIFTEVKNGPFEVSVQTTGELRAKNSEDINAPRGLRSAGIYRVEISDMVPEGTVVEEGEYIATLDRSELSSEIQSLENELDQLKSQYRHTQLDTMLELRGLRDDLIDMEHNLEERRIAVEQSKFEPPATQRQAQIELERARRNFQQAKDNYEIRREQAETEMLEVASDVRQLERRIRELEEMMESFEIKAPRAGMVIYRRAQDGSRREVGSTVTPWNPAVATLPDLRTMISRTFVNEIDISKVRPGQEVKVGIDAFPGKELPGEVTSVANVGEEMRRADARVFEVEVLITREDTSLRPAMTTSNRIITESYERAMYIPLEGLHQNDTMEYVIRNRGRNGTIQQVKTGASNDNQIIIEVGLEAGEEIYLTLPDNIDDLPVKGIEAS